jgi:regulation of enolase protein 1 (concanavalin A-like superfamily)/dipeptidyl aminopeptidase/acylaminoacyl peptidase
MKSALVTTVLLFVSFYSPVNSIAQAPPSPEPAAEQIAFAALYPGGGGACDANFGCTPFAIPSLMDVDGSHIFQAAFNPTTRGWSPDETKILETFSDIFVTPVVGGSIVNLTNHPATYMTPAWSPDGSKIAFASDRDGSMNLYIMKADGSDVARIPTGGGVAWYPTWSPDSARLAFSCVVDFVSPPFSGNHDICVINVDGSGFARLTDDPGADDEPDWSPDGTSIVFTTGRYGGTEIAVMRPDGSNVTPLIPGLQASTPSWSSNGTRVAFVEYLPFDPDAPNTIIQFIDLINADGSGLIEFVAAGFGPSWRPWKGVPNNRPVASFTFSCTGHTCGFDASGSSDSDGSVVAYGWQFEDGMASGSVVTHTFSAGHVVRLFVMDDRGALAPFSRNVNQPPIVSFIVTCNILACTFDGSATFDPDGTIEGVDWEFGDSNGGGPLSTTHTYAVAGTYPVTLTVVDQEGGRTTSAQSVTVNPPANDLPPVVSITTPKAGDTLPLGTVTVTAAASDPDGTISSVRFYANAGSLLFGTATTPPYTVTWGGLPPGSYTITAVAFDNFGLSTTSAPVTFSIVSALPPPSPWTDQDVGATDSFGTASFDGGLFTVRGSGNTWGSSDTFHFVSQPIDGDVTIVARLTGMDNTSTFAKAGLMIRESTAPDAAHVILDVRPTNDLEFMTRSSSGAPTTFLSTAVQQPPAWLRLIRSGTTVTGWVSADGITWRLVGQTTLAIGSHAVAGLVVCSVAAGVLNVATFDNVNVTAGVGPLPSPWSDQDVGATGAAGSASLSGGLFTVKGSGSNVWGSSDGFNFVSQPIGGDVTIVARLTGMDNTSTFAKAGLMIRESTAPDAAHVILDVRPTNDLEFMTRAVSGAETTFLATAVQPPPAWLRLIRSGPAITGWVSPDGVTWTLVGQTTLAIGSNAVVGLVVCSVAPGVMDTATFDNVRVSNGALLGP